ncbi:3-hydroxybutyryl-CoA dehydrogenase [Roseomonas elaeocarpi]|uniref:3-hydroxybutyryl-CoA dehydrogenase n=1 Tax=Roseomonas elaeocarpi TaxID=907779 RepID=A0ABV6JTL7_9PROT
MSGTTREESAAPAPEVRTLGVVGAGQMGGGIAHVAAASGLEVVLFDVQVGALDKARATVARNMERQVAKGTLDAAARDAALGRIALAPEMAALGACDLVVEAATEREELKARIYRDLAAHLRADAILATNTSSISVTRLAAATDRPERFVGMHFFNPVPVMQLVEVIRGIATADATVAAVEALAARMGKTTAVAEDFPGFIVNRILLPMINEAATALNEGVGTVAAIDTAMKLGTNQPMGPLQLADFIGLDTCLAILRVLQEGTGDPRYRPSPLLVKYVDAGWLGRKSGRGFYDYREDPPRPTR